ncbi:MAG TPA: hypothetical protein DCQ93_01985 [Bacteroidetes bacterium]|nr:hypothetical protein [Bacteroidota bacterium]
MQDFTSFDFIIRMFNFQNLWVNDFCSAKLIRFDKESLIFPNIYSQYAGGSNITKGNCITVENKKRRPKISQRLSLPCF